MGKTRNTTYTGFGKLGHKIGRKEHILVAPNARQRAIGPNKSQWARRTRIETDVSHG